MVHDRDLEPAGCGALFLEQERRICVDDDGVLELCLGFGSRTKVRVIVDVGGWWVWAVGRLAVLRACELEGCRVCVLLLPVGGNCYAVPRRHPRRPPTATNRRRAGMDGSGQLSMRASRNMGVSASQTNAALSAEDMAAIMAG